MCICLVRYPSSCVCNCTIVDRSNPMIAPRFESQVAMFVITSTHACSMFSNCIRELGQRSSFPLIFDAPCSFSIPPAFAAPQGRRDRNLAERAKETNGTIRILTRGPTSPAQKEPWYDASDWLVQLSLVFVYKLRTNTLLTRVRHPCDHTIAITTSVSSAVSSWRIARVFLVA